MGLIAIKEKGIDLPKNENINNCLKYAKNFALMFARNNKITIVKNITNAKKYEDVVSEYNVDKDDVVVLTFNKYTNSNVGELPVIISDAEEEIEDKSDVIVTDKSILATKDDVLGIKSENSSRIEFIKHLYSFDRMKNKEITNLVFGDNLAAIFNPNGTIEKYGLENTSTKKWIQSESGIVYNDDDFKTKTTYCSQYTHNYYDDYTDYYYNDYNAKKYECEICHDKVSSVFLKETKFICTKCFNNK